MDYRANIQQTLERALHSLKTKRLDPVTWNFYETGPHPYEGSPQNYQSRYAPAIAMYMNHTGKTTITLDGETVDLAELFILGCQRTIDFFSSEVADSNKHQLAVETAWIAYGFWLAREKLEASPLWTQERQNNWVYHFTQWYGEGFIYYPYGIAGGPYSTPPNWKSFNLVKKACLRALGWKSYINADYDEAYKQVKDTYYASGFMYERDSYSAMTNRWLGVFRYVNRAMNISYNDAEITRRLSDLANEWIYLTNSKGQLIPWGRSCGPAYIHPWTELVVYLNDGWDPGIARAMAEKNYDWLIAQMWNSDGSFNKTLGPRAPELSIETYESRANVGGGACFALSLALAANEIWETPAKPLPIEEYNFAHSFPAINYLAVGNKEDGHVISFIPTEHRGAPNYRHFVSSFEFAESIGYMNSNQHHILPYGLFSVKHSTGAWFCTHNTLQDARSFECGELGLSLEFGELQDGDVKTGIIGKSFHIIKGGNLVRVTRITPNGKIITEFRDTTMPIPHATTDILTESSGTDWATLKHGNLSLFLRNLKNCETIDNKYRVGTAADQLNRLDEDSHTISARSSAQFTAEKTFAVHQYYRVDGVGLLPQAIIDKVKNFSENGDKITMSVEDYDVAASFNSVSSITAGLYSATSPTSTITGLSGKTDGSSYGGADIQKIIKNGVEVVTLTSAGRFSVHRVATDKAVIKTNKSFTIKKTEIPQAPCVIYARDNFGAMTRVPFTDTSDNISISQATVDQYLIGNTTFEVIGVTSINILPTSFSLKPSETVQFIVADQNGKDITNDVIWSVSDATIASINSKGLLTALKVGSVVVTASIGQLSSTSQIDVYYVDPEFPIVKPTLVHNGNEFELSIVINNLLSTDRVIVEKGTVPEGQLKKEWFYLCDASLVDGTLLSGTWRTVLNEMALRGEYYFRFKVVR